MVTKEHPKSCFMPGITTHIVILQQVIHRLESSGDPAQVVIANALKAEPKYAALGAVGPDLVDFMPSDIRSGALGGASPYLSFWLIVFGIAHGTGPTPGLVSVIEKISNYLEELTNIAEDDDLFALKDFRDNSKLTDLVSKLADLKTIVDNVQTLVQPLLDSISAGQKPIINTNDPAAGKAWPSVAWSCRDFLNWKSTGKFARALVQKARASGDARFLAYAYGYLVCYSSKVTGAPFVNSIVGGPYRTQWWRTRWVGMYLDAWVYGFYNQSSRPTLAGDDPSPAYESWPSLCNANVQNQIELPGLDVVAVLDAIKNKTALPKVLPDDFTDFWYSALEDTFGPVPPSSRFSRQDPPGSDSPYDANGKLNRAYLFTWLILWFQTSGKVLGCNPAPPMAPPDDDCGANPPWVDATSPPPSDPENAIEEDVDEGEIICGIILALLGLGIPPLFVKGIEDIFEGANDINWEKFRCHLYWYRLYFYNGLKAIHEASVLVGIHHPYAKDLAIDEATLNFLGFNFTFDSGKRLTKSRANDRSYPADVWNGIAPSWTADPTGSEAPRTVAYYYSEYPPFWIDDAGANPLSRGKVIEGGPWPMKVIPGTERTAEFGNAVDNAIEILRRAGDELPNWNLDADRGMASFTWEVDDHYANPLNIKAEP